MSTLTSRLEYLYLLKRVIVSFEFPTRSKLVPATVYYSDRFITAFEWGRPPPTGEIFRRLRQIFRGVYVATKYSLNSV